jgi:hypothetical protein
MEKATFCVEVKGDQRMLLFASLQKSGSLSIILKREGRVNPNPEIPITRDEVKNAPAITVSKYSVHPTKWSDDGNTIHFSFETDREGQGVHHKPEASVIKKEKDRFYPICFLAIADARSAAFNVKNKYRSSIVSLGEYNPQTRRYCYMVLLSHPDKEWPKVSPIADVNVTSVVMGSYRISILTSVILSPSTNDGVHTTFVPKLNYPTSSDEKEVAFLWAVSVESAINTLRPYERGRWFNP